MLDISLISDYNPWYEIRLRSEEDADTSGNRSAEI